MKFKDIPVLGILTATAFVVVSAGSVQAGDCNSNHNAVTNFNQPVTAKAYALTIKVKQPVKTKAYALTIRANQSLKRRKQ